MRKIKNNGQSVLELCVLTVCAAVALIAMSAYIIRAMQGSFKEQADSIGGPYVPGGTNATIVDVVAANSTFTSRMLTEGEFYSATNIDPGDDSRYYFLSNETIIEDTNTKNSWEQYEGFEK